MIAVRDKRVLSRFSITGLKARITRGDIERFATGLSD